MTHLKSLKVVLEPAYLTFGKILTSRMPFTFCRTLTQISMGEQKKVEMQ